MKTQGERMLRRSEAASYLREKYGFGAIATLAKLAVVGGGPQFRKVGRFPVYSPSDLDEWVISKTSEKVSSTAELN